MKNFEKIVPAVALGIAVAGFGATDAYAAEDGIPADIDKVDNKEVAPAAANTMNTQLNSLTPAGDNTPVAEDGTQNSTPTAEDSTQNSTPAAEDGTQSSTPAAEDGTQSNTPAAEDDTQSNTTIEDFNTNMSVDMNSDGELGEGDVVNVTFNGNVSVNSTPQEPVTDEETGAVTNIEKVEVKGDVKATTPGVPFKEDEDKVEGAIESSTEKDENGNATGFDKGIFEQEIEKLFGQDVTIKEDTDGSFSFETSKTVDKTLNDDERDAILAAKGITKNESGQYVNAEGQVVNVTWGEDNSTVTNTTTWTVTITDLPAGTVNGDEGAVSGIVQVPNIDSGVTGDGLSDEEAWAILEQYKEPGSYTEDNVTYTITKTEGRGEIALPDGYADEITNMSTAVIYEKFFSGKEGYTLNDAKNKILKDGHELELNFSGSNLTITYYTFTVTKTTQGTSSGGGYNSTGATETAENEVQEKAQEELESLKTQAEKHVQEANKAAMLDAIKAALAKVGYTATDEDMTNVQIGADKKSWSLSVGETKYKGTVDLQESAQFDESQLPDLEAIKAALTSNWNEENHKATASWNFEWTVMGARAEATIVVEEAHTVNLGEAELAEIADPTENNISATDVNKEMVENAVKDGKGKLFKGETIEEARQNQDGSYTIITMKEVTSEGITIVYKKTYTFEFRTPDAITGGNETGDKTNGGYNEIEKPSNDTDLIIRGFEGDDFFLKQGQGGAGIVWIANKETWCAERNLKVDDNVILEYYHDNYAKSLHVKTSKVISGYEKFDFSELGDSDSLKNTWVQVSKDGTVTIQGNISHLNMHPDDYKPTPSFVGTYDKVADRGWKEVDGTHEYGSATGSTSGKIAVEKTVEATYTPPTTGEDKVLNSGSLLGVEITGDLHYSYNTPSGIKVEFGGVTNADRHIDAEVDVSTTTTPERPTDPTDPGDRPSRPTNPDRDRPTNPPTTEITDPEVPLAETPEEPAVEIPDGDVPLAEIPEEEVPLADTPDVTIPDGDVPLADAPGTPSVTIPDGEVPLADVPKTGDVSPLWSFSAILSALGLGVLLKKRKED